MARSGDPHAGERDARWSVYVDAARAAWPELAVDLERFAEYVLARTTASGPPPLAHAEDLWLACACVTGVPRATECFQRRFDPIITRVLARRRASAAMADDARQGVYERLLVGRDGQPPKIAEYQGTGRLESWVATTAANSLLMLQRADARRREQTARTENEPLPVPLDPELEMLRARYRVPLEEAIVASLAALSDRDRALLRLHLGKRLSIDTLGAMYGVNRATAARWLVAARRALLERARASIRETLGLSSQEYESLGAVLKSQLDVSLVEHLDGEG